MSANAEIELHGNDRAMSASCGMRLLPALDMGGFGLGLGRVAAPVKRWALRSRSLC